jgi:methoxymalonate biosynthesis protein
MGDDKVKCLVWDLDNTLWQGVLLEDGDVHVPEDIRRVVIELDERGILQSVASKNDYEHAFRWLEKLSLAEYMLLPQIGWGLKSAGIQTIADRLQFAQHTIAFIDDQPAERAEVTHRLPAVRCYPADMAAHLLDLPEFTPAMITKDSRDRRVLYQANFARDAARNDYTGPDEDFLRTLDLQLTISRPDEQGLHRVEELTLRTSQMNATGVHYSHDTLSGLLSDPHHEVLVVSMSDRFGQHGAVGVMLLEIHEELWHLKLLATSCRVVSFGAGTVLLRWLSDQAARSSAHLVADFRKTERNRMMEVAYRFAGFTDDACFCRAVLAPGSGQVQRLHLVPGGQDAPGIMRIESVDIAAGRRSLTEGRPA